LGKNILITRTDRIGDLVLSLPVITTISKVFPNYCIYLMVSSYSFPLVEKYPGVTGVIKYDPEDYSNIGRRKQLITYLKDLKIDVSISLFYDPELLSILKKTGISKRVGPLSKISGIFKYTKPVTQHRSRVEKHELEYNLELLKSIGIRKDDFDTIPKIPVSDILLKSVLNKLNNSSYRFSTNGYVVIHPCMGGSAKNWSFGYYAELASRIFQKTDTTIFLTGTKKEKDILDVIVKHIKGRAYNIAGILNLKELTAFLSGANLFVGPLTGPLHIAAATGTPVVGIYSPIKVQSKKRWGPIGVCDKKVIEPNVNCPEKYHCSMTKCKYYDCMESIDVDDVLTACMNLSLSKEKIKQMDLSLI
jgi:ADP-heptose:LPS heptosyltransferase